MKTKYKLLTNIFTVEYVDKVEDEDGNWMYGKCSYRGDLAIVTISTKNDEGKPLSEDVIQCSLRHELFHVILDSLYFKDLSANETLVEWLANATLTLNKQGLNI